MEKPTKSKAIHALSWSLVQEATLRALQFGISVVLARLLSPAEFGLVGMLGIFLALAQMLVDGGFASALIQAKQPTEAHKSSIFYFNILGSVLFALLLWAGAPWVAAFYKQPQLTLLLRVLSLLPVINGFGLVQNTLLMRQLDFKKQTLILATSTIVSGSAALVLAWRGFGVWTLVWQQLLQTFLRTALLWCLSDWRPAWMFSFQALREMFRFGGGMLGSVILSSVYENLYPLLIGKFFSADKLGYFGRAQNLQSVASQSLGAIANRVTFPLFSTMQDDLPRFRAGLRRAVSAVTFLQFPMMIGLAVVAKPLVLLVFTEKWAPAIPYLQLLAFAGLLFPLHVLNLNVLTALGRSDLFLRLEIFKVAVFLTTGLLTFRWGVTAMICGQIGCDVTAYFLNARYTKELLGYTIADQLRDFCPCLAASALMGLLVTLAASFLPESNILQLGFRVALGVALYLVICRAIKSEGLNEFAGLVFRKRAVSPTVPAARVEQPIP